MKLGAEIASANALQPPLVFVSNRWNSVEDTIGHGVPLTLPKAVALLCPAADVSGSSRKVLTGTRARRLFRDTCRSLRGIGLRARVLAPGGARVRLAGRERAS